MKNTERVRIETTETILQRAPAYPRTGMTVLKILKEAIDRAELPKGGSLEQKRFGELIGVPKSTINDWMHGDVVAQIQRFVCGLERLSEAKRAEFFARFAACALA